MTENDGGRNWFTFGTKKVSETRPAATESRVIHERTPLKESPALELDIPKSYASQYFTNGKARVKVDDDYIVSLIRRTSTLNIDDDDLDQTTGGKNVASGKRETPQGTTWGQTVVHLVKGYVGCGILSLPWAISQLGIPLGLLGILFMAVWTSYNCWTVTKIKQYIERMALDDEDDEAATDLEDDDETSSRRSGSMATSIASVSNATTYPDVGEWAYGAKFHSYVSFCICSQQLAICTVFVSFVGENLQAALSFWDSPVAGWGRSVVTALCLPAFLGLSCGMPTVKSMVPLMVLASFFMTLGFCLLGWIGLSKWEDRPRFDELPELKLDGNAFMALCGILYSFEGICIILPVESSMRYPVKEFKSAFGFSMVVVTMLLCGMAGLSVIVFGEVTNGSITAFLLETYGDELEDETDFGIASKTVLSNILVSLSIILSYPLMLYPAVELVAPSIFDWAENRRRRSQKSEEDSRNSPAKDEDDEDSLGFIADDEHSEGFEPMAGIPEHGVPSMQSLPSMSDSVSNGDATHHDDVGTKPTGSNGNGTESHANMDAETYKTAEATDGGGMSESASLLSRLSSNMSYQRSIVESLDSDSDDESTDENGMPSPRTRKSRRHSTLEWVLPGDSPLLRAGLVIGTFLVAVLVPNVQSLVSLVGAVTGSSTALLIPPILELAYIRHMEAKEATGRLGSFLLGDWEGGPSIASKRLLFGTSPKIDRRYSSSTRSKKRKQNKYLCDKILSWFLLVLGSVFALIGSYFSIRDILQNYM